MIDIETDVFHVIAAALRSVYSGIFVSGEYTPSPASFPAVTIAEMDNTVYQKMRTTAIENAAQLMYEVNVYSNKVGYKKMEAKTVMSTIDQEFARLGFTRTMCNPVPNLQDATIFRLTARYEAVAVPEGAQEETVRIYTQ